MAGSAPSWKRFDTYPPYEAYLQQAGGQSSLPLTAASSVLFIAKNSGNTATSVLIKGPMTIASTTNGYVTYAWGASDLVLADTFNVEYEIHWQAGGYETVPNDSYDSFTCVADLDGGV